MMSLTVQRPEQRSQLRQLAAWVFGVALLVAALVPLNRLLEDMPRADVTFVNRSPWDINVDLLLEEGNSRVGLATIGQGNTVQVQEIVEPDGDTWTFEFAARGRTALVTMSDERLRANRFRVAVPDALIDELEAAREPPNPY